MKYTEEYVKINGIEQYFLHYASNVETVLIMLHGGPGIPNSYGAYKLAPHLTFTNVVFYDQRGAGKTRIRNNIDPAAISTELFVEDLRQTVAYVKEKYQTDHIVLAGHSWGSQLGAEFVLKYPNDVKAFIAYGVVIDLKVQEKIWYRRLKELVYQTGKKRAIKRFERINPEYPNIPREEYIASVPTLSSLEFKYGFHVNNVEKIYRKSPVMKLKDGMQMATAEKFNHKLLGELYDFNLRPVKEYQVPIFYILGREDHWTASTVAAEYFETFKAPTKALYWIEDAGHMTDTDQPEAFAEAVKDIVKQIK